MDSYYYVKDESLSDFALLDSSVWHIPTSTVFNDGWPFLKQYITFDRYLFSSNNVSYGNVILENEQVYIDVPQKNVDQTVINWKNIINNKNEIYGIKIFAVATSGCYFKQWNNPSGTKNFIAVFDKESYNFNIKVINEKDVDITSSATTFAVSMKHNSALNIEVVYTGGTTKIKLGTFGIICVVDDIYDLEYLKINNKTYSKLPDLGNNNSFHTITIKLKLKTYGVGVV